MVSYQMEANQQDDNAANFVELVIAGATTLTKVKLCWYHSFSQGYVDTSNPGYAPPNLLMGWGLVSHGATTPAITATNCNTAPYYQGGYGRMTGSDTCFDTNPEAGTVFQQVTSFEYEYEAPTYLPSETDLFISWDWLGSGYWPSPAAWVTWQLEVWSTTG